MKKNRREIFRGFRMKIKSDFVTNSSSTSFIISCEAGVSKKDDFIDKFNSFLKDYIKERTWDEEFQEPHMLTSDMVTLNDSGVFTITDFAPIYNSEQDIPQYIKELFLNKDSDAYKSLSRAGIKLINVDIKDQNK
jgi:hypothetical protein